MQDIALLDARRGVTMFEKISVPILGLVENMSSYLCPQCGHQASIFGKDGAVKLAEKLRVPCLGKVSCCCAAWLQEYDCAWSSEGALAVSRCPWQLGSGKRQTPARP